MKRFFPTSLALLLVVGSLGHLFAAALCPGMLGHDCCLKNMRGPQPGTQPHQHMPGMAMDTMTDESMPMDGSDMQDMTLDDARVPPRFLAIQEVTPVSTTEELVRGNKLVLPIDGCLHCMSHLGVQNAPLSSVNMPNQSNKDLGSVPVPVSKFLARPAMTVSPGGQPWEHAPPGSSAPRHILISVFLI